jgi:hypothetical protein
MGCCGLKPPQRESLTHFPSFRGFDRSLQFGRLNWQIQLGKGIGFTLISWDYDALWA